MPVLNTRNLFFGRKLKIFSITLLLFAMYSPQVWSQIEVNTVEPVDLTTCGEAKLFEVTVSNFGNITFDGVSLTVNFPVGMIYEAGSITGVNVSESNISDLSAPIFTLPDLTPAINLTITFLAKATCASTNNTGDFTNQLVINHTTGQQNFTSTPYNIQVPSISITNTTNDFVNGTVGDVFSRTFTISNFGFGAVGELMFQDIHPAGLQITGSDFGTLNQNGNTATITLGTNDFNQIGNNNGLLEFGESITLTENCMIVSCADGISEISVGWGCEGEICEDFEQFAEVTVETESPFLEWSYGMTSNASLCEAGSLEIILVNNTVESFPGAAAAYNIILEPGLGNPEEPDSLRRYDCFNLSNFIIGNNLIVSDTNNFMGYGLDLNQFGVDPDGVGGLDDLDNDGQFDDLAAGDTVRLLLNAGLDFDCFDCFAEVLPLTTFRFAQGFDSQCGEVFYQKENNDFYEHQIGQTNVIDNLQFEYENGDTIFLEFDFNRAFNGFKSACSDDSVTVNLTIPNGVTFEPFPAPTFNEELVDYEINGNILTLAGEGIAGVLTATFTTECDSTNFDFSLPCANANDIPNFVNFDYSIDYQCFTDTCSAPVNLYCGETSPFFISCFSLSDSEILGVVTDTFFADRITLGWTDENLNQLVSSTDPSIRLKHGISNDVLRLEVSSSVIGSEEFDNAYLRIFHSPLTDKKYFTYLSDTISFYDNETNQTIVCAGLETPEVDTLYSGLFKMDIELEERFNTGCFSGLHLTEGDSMTFVIYVQLENASLPSAFTAIPNFSAGFIFDFEDEELICKRKGTDFSVLRTVNSLLLNTPSAISKCEHITVSNDLAQGPNAPDKDVFPFEYRPNERYDSVIFELPLGINYLQGSARLKYDFRPGNSDIEAFEIITTSIPDPEIYTDGTTVFLKFINNDIYPIVDFLKKKTRYEIVFDASYDCRLMPNFEIKANNFYERFVYSTNLPAPMFFEEVRTKTVNYESPSRAFSAQQQTFESFSNDVFWTFDLCNTPNSQAEGEDIPNNWIAFEIDNININITDLTEITNPNAPVPITLDSYGTPGDFWAKIGTIDSLACRTFQLDATFQNCVLDSITMRSGHNCAGYPIDPNTGYEVLENSDVLGDFYGCNTLELREQLLLLPRNPDFQISLVDAPSSLVDLCQPLTYEFKILNTQIGPAFQLEIEIDLPPGNGTTLIPNTSEYQYPTDEPYQMLPDPVNIAGTNRYVWDFSSIDPTLLMLGLVGSDKAPDNELLLRFQLLTNCDYLDGFTPKLTARGISICNEVNESTPFIFPPLLLNGFVPENEYLLDMSVSNIEPCNNNGGVSISAENSGTDNSNDGQSIVVIMDQNFDYIPNSITNIQNFPNPPEPTNTLIDTIRVLKWAFPVDLIPSDLVELSFEIEAINPDLLTCGTTDLLTQITQKTTIDCVTEPQGFCEIDLVLEQRQFTTPIIFPDFIFNHVSATSIPLGNDMETVMFDFEISNISDLDYTDSLTVSIYEDTNGSGAFETEIDGIVNHYFLTDTLIVVGDSASFQFTADLPSSTLCNLFLVLSTDQNSCLCETQAIPVPFIQLENTIQNDTLCVEESVFLGFDPIDGYSYEWQPAGAFPTDIANPEYTYTGMLPDENFVTEIFTLTTTRIGGCASSDTVSLTTIQNNIDLVVSDYNGSDISCFEADDAVITATIETVLDNFTIEWNNGEMTEIIDSLSPGTYTITVTDVMNCKSIESVVIEEPAEVIGEITVTTDYFGFDIQCFEGDNGALELLATGGTGDLTLSWTTGSTDLILTDLTAGNYEVTITDVNNCADTVNVNLTEPPAVVIETETTDNLCFGDEEGIIEIIDAQPEDIYQYGLGCNNFTESGFFPNLAAGNYILCVQTATDCIYENEITVLEPAELTVEIIQDTLVFLGDPAVLFAQSSNPIDSIFWTPSEFLNCDNCLEVEANVLDNTIFNVFVFDQNGCPAEDAALVAVNKKPQIYVPNVFSPNGDGINDFLHIFANSGVEKINEFKIFSRWGALIFEDYEFQPNDPVHGWDGVFLGKEMEPAVFVWFLEATLIDGSEVFLKGDFTLVR